MTTNEFSNFYKKIKELNPETNIRISNNDTYGIIVNVAPNLLYLPDGFSLSSDFECFDNGSISIKVDCLYDKNQIRQ